MKTSTPHVVRFALPAATALVALVVAVPAWATTSFVTLNLEGNPTCSSLGPNDDIISIKDTDPNVGGNGPLTGPLGQEVTYTLGSSKTTITSWSSTVPVNYVILKARGNAGAKVFHFGPAGTTTDTDVEGLGDLTAVSFCYGLAFTEPPPEPIDITAPGAPIVPDCEDLTLGDGLLAGSDVVCPLAGTEDTGKRVLISLDPEAPNFGIRFCSCNLTVNQDDFLRCDPELPARDPTEPVTLDGGCPSGLPTTRVPVNILGVQDPHSKICFTLGGKRRCYSH
jgi:hypothetical protein